MLKALFGSNRRLTVLAAVFLVCGLPLIMPANVAAQDRDELYAEIAAEAEALERFTNLLKKVSKVARPTVVHIDATKDSDDRPSSIEETGSGVIIRIDAKHYVLTNRHVIRDATLDHIDVKLTDGRVIYPQKTWADQGTDVAIMEISASNLPSARVGDSDKLEIGDFVLAVGSPFGLSHSVTFGIISAKGRRDLQFGDDKLRYQDFMQTDASINPGNSGGPLLNLRGEVIGINTAIASATGRNEGIGFSIPSNMAMAVARQLVQRGQVVRAFLGVQLDPDFGPEEAADLGLPRPEGARVTGITPNSPAASAELQVRDVILAFDGKRIEDDGDLVNRVSLTDVGKEVAILVLRDGSEIELKVKVGNRADFDPRR